MENVSVLRKLTLADLNADLERHQPSNVIQGWNHHLEGYLGVVKVSFNLSRQLLPRNFSERGMQDNPASKASVRDGIGNHGLHVY